MRTSTATTPGNPTQSVAPLKLLVILGSTRQGRASERFGEWVMEAANDDTRFETELIDLRDWDLPLLDVEQPPSAGGYSEASKRFGQKIEGADAYLIVTPEYNHGVSAVLKNALDSVYHEWNEKAVGFVSYGAGAGGARAVEHLKQITNWLRLAPVPNGLHVIHYYKQSMEEIKEQYGRELGPILDDLARWGGAMRHLRQSNPRQKK